MTKRAFQHLLNTLDCTTICAGHPDEQFVEYLKSKDRVVKSPDGTVAAYLDSTPILLKGQNFTETEL